MAPSILSPTILTSNGSTVPLYKRTVSSNHYSTTKSLAVQEPSPSYHGYHHVTWWVGNAKQAAAYYVARMGFRPVAYAGLETGSRSVASHVVENGGVRFVFSSPIRAGKLPLPQANPHNRSAVGSAKMQEEDLAVVREMHAHLEQHGDAVKDVAFEVDDARSVYFRAIARGAVSVSKPRVLKDQFDGEVIVASIKTYGDTTHTFVEKIGYKGVFLPGFKKAERVDPLWDILPECHLQVIDHCVGNQDWDQMEEACDL
jgi:4-hydroxyphenylpyruvate dioxygenase